MIRKSKRFTDAKIIDSKDGKLCERDEFYLERYNTHGYKVLDVTITLEERIGEGWMKYRVDISHNYTIEADSEEEARDIVTEHAENNHMDLFGCLNYEVTEVED